MITKINFQIPFQQKFSALMVKQYPIFGFGAFMVSIYKHQWYKTCPSISIASIIQWHYQKCNVSTQNQHENQNITFKIKLRGPLQTKRNLPLSGGMEICDQGYGTEHSSEQFQKQNKWEENNESWIARQWEYILQNLWMTNIIHISNGWLSKNMEVIENGSNRTNTFSQATHILILQRAVAGTIIHYSQMVSNTIVEDMNHET